MKTINALKARSQFGTMLDKVSQENEHYTIERLRQPLAVMIPVGEYEQYYKKNISTIKKQSILDEFTRFRKKYGKKITGHQSSTELIRRMRKERTDHLLRIIHGKNT